MSKLTRYCYYLNQKRRYSDLVAKIQSTIWSKQPAIIDSILNQPTTGKIITYSQLYTLSKRLAIHLNSKYGSSNIKSIGAFINVPESDYVVTMLATWILGKTFVPLCPTHPIKEVEYFVHDSSCNIVIHNIPDANLKNYSISELNDPNITVININTSFQSTISDREFLLELDGESKKEEKVKATEHALVLYTSGTTGKPKGVLHTHTGLKYMIEGLVEIWKYSSDDVILHFLPLHHLHGVLNKLLCMLYAGGTIRFINHYFESSGTQNIWHILAASTNNKDFPIPQHFKPTLFMAVPTVYGKLMDSLDKQPDEIKGPAMDTLKVMRLHVSGSAALPDIMMERWKNLTGHTLLERYGMSELGMVLSNPYEGLRVKGSVGFPLPYVQVRIVDENEEEVTTIGIPGELRVKGPTVFKEYLNRPEVTKESFDKQGWFRTGDIAIRDRGGYYRLLGRNSSDIIKRAGYKLSALEIEREILSYPEISEAAVVGIPDEKLGENVVAIITLQSNISSMNNENATEILNKYLDDKLAHYKRPKYVHIVSSIPRNHMGKVNKKTLLKELNLSF